MASTITSSGVASGMDFESIITASVESRRAQNIKKTTRPKEITSLELEGVGKLKDALKTFSSSLDSLTEKNSFNARKATINQPTDNPFFTVNTKGDASNGEYEIAVNSLASSEKLTQDFKKDTTFAEGTLTITIPGVPDKDNPHKTVEPRKIEVKVNDGDNLAQIRKKINANDYGVNASIVVDADGNQRLTLDSGITGKTDKSNFTIEFAAADTTADTKWQNLPEDQISNLGADEKAAYDKWASAQKFNFNDGPKDAWTKVEGTNAKITVDGMHLESKTNTFDNQIAGLSLTVHRKSETEDVNGVAQVKTNKLSVSQDVDGITKKVTDFVNSYNTLMDTMDALYKHNTYTDGKNNFDGGSLAGDSQLKSLQSSLQNLMTNFTSQAAGGTNGQGAGVDIYSLGLSVDKKGHFSLDSAKFKEGIEDNFNAVVNLFTKHSDTVKPGDPVPSDAGLIVKLDSFLEDYTKTNGVLDQRSDDLNQKIRRYEEQETKNAESLAKYEETLRQTYSRLDVTIGGYNQSLSYLQAVLG